MRHCRYLYAVGNSLIRKFWFCTVPVKLKLFKIYCGNIYSGHLWSNYSTASLRKVTTAYNSILRRLLNIPRHCDGVSYSAKAMFATYNVLNFAALMRKMLYSFSCRLTNHSVLNFIYENNRVKSRWWQHFRSTIYVGIWLLLAYCLFFWHCGSFLVCKINVHP